jgi:hypothetical protein
MSRGSSKSRLTVSLGTGYVEYEAFHELRPVNQGNKFLFLVRRWLLESGYDIHVRRDATEWKCGHPNDNTHFHKN